MKEVAQALGVSASTAKRWHKFYGLPVKQTSGSKYGRWVAEKDELEEWLKTFYKGFDDSASGVVIEAYVNEKKGYGLKKGQFKEMWKSQNFRCKICQRMIDVRLAQVDHDHSKNCVRGILCRSCNLGLGAFHDDCDRLRNAIQYLENNQSSSS